MRGGLLFHYTNDRGYKAISRRGCSKRRSPRAVTRKELTLPSSLQEQEAWASGSSSAGAPIKRILCFASPARRASSPSTAEEESTYSTAKKTTQSRRGGKVPTERRQRCRRNSHDRRQ